MSEQWSVNREEADAEDRRPYEETLTDAPGSPGPELDEESGELVGTADRDADAARTGALDEVEPVRDTAGVPTGRDDAAADARRTGADPDAVS